MNQRGAQAGFGPPLLGRIYVELSLEVCLNADMAFDAERFENKTKKLVVWLQKGR